MKTKSFITMILLLLSTIASSAAEQNSALLLMDGDSIARAGLEMIQSAQQEVYSVEFLMRDDTYSLMKMAALRQKARQGLKVVMQVDAMHLLVEPAMLYHLQQEGVQVQVYHDFLWKRFFKMDSRDHTKLLVVDGIRMKTGDTNTGNEYVGFGDGHKMQNRDVLVTGPVARKARHYAVQIAESDLISSPRGKVTSKEEAEKQLNDFKRRTSILNKILKFVGIAIDAPDIVMKPKIPFFTQEQVQDAAAKIDAAALAYDELRVQKGWGRKTIWEERASTPLDRATFMHDPVDNKGKSPGIDVGVLEFFKRAQKSLMIISPYLILAPDEKAAIAEAMARGVKVEIYTNSLLSSDNKMVQAAYEMRAAEIAKMGPLKIYEYDGNETWHAKMLIGDHKHMMIMGYNVDYRSKHINMETGQFLQSEVLVTQMKDQLEKDRSQFTLVAEDGQLLPSKFTRITCEAVFAKTGFIKGKMGEMALKMIEKKL